MNNSITMEMVEKLRAHASVSYEEAKNALEQSKGDMLDAVIYLEKLGKIKTPSSSEIPEEDFIDSCPDCGQPLSEKEWSKKNRRNSHSHYHRKNCYHQCRKDGQFSSKFKNFLSWCGRIVHKGNINTFDVVKRNELVISVPITVLVLALMMFFWIIVPLLLIGLFFDYTYFFNGPDIKRDTFNHVTDSVVNMANEIRNSMKDDVDNGSEQRE